MILLAVLAFVLFDAFREGATAPPRRLLRWPSLPTMMKRSKAPTPTCPGGRSSVFLILGLIGLPLGATCWSTMPLIIARAFGVSDAVIGLTLVALGTSLPELATTVMAALRRQADVALGNVIGSNMFNLLAIIGITTLVGPIPVTNGFLAFDLWVMLGRRCC